MEKDINLKEKLKETEKRLLNMEWVIGALATAFSDHPDTQKRAAHIKDLAEAAGYKLNSTGSSANAKPGTVSVGNKPSGTNTSGVKPSGGNSGNDNTSNKPAGVKVGGQN